MSEAPRVDPKHLRLLVDHRNYIDDEVVEFDENTWALHAVLPYVGEVPVAVFDSYAEAKRVLDEILRPVRGEREP
jgi:hypothetical protein